MLVDELTKLINCNIDGVCGLIRENCWSKAEDAIEDHEWMSPVASGIISLLKKTEEGTG